MSCCEVKSGELVFSLLVHPRLELVDLAVLKVVLAQEVVLPSVFKNDFEAVRLVSVGGIGQKTELLGVAHAHQVQRSFLKFKIVYKALVVFVSYECKHPECLCSFNIHTWLDISLTRFKAVTQMRDIHH